MAKSEPKKILTEEEMRIKIEEAIRFFNSGKKDLLALYNFNSSLLSIYNKACEPGQEEVCILNWVANFPDN